MGLPKREFSRAEALILGEIGDPADCKCLSFRHLAERTGLPRDEVIDACRTLKADGFADCYTGLWTDDGEPYGSGYGLSRAYLAEMQSE
ncbi:hypothetical protein FHR22_002606 [Sphingopyxis panaciterrae]|nr:hypothetical protein [Sphingopyxis panaciterrae]